MTTSTSQQQQQPLSDVLSATEAAAYGRVVQAALEDKGGEEPPLLCDEHPTALFMDTALFQKECRALIQAFEKARNASSSPRYLHAFAVKACPLVGVLRRAAAAGMGGECASEGEVALCLAAGMTPDSIVLDAPCKTNAVLRRMLTLGVHINADNLPELERMYTIWQDLPKDDNETRKKPPSIGLRINPQIGSGTIGMTSTAGTASKFGVPLREQRAAIVQAFTTAPYADFLSCIHIHVGSQGVSPQQLVDGVKEAVALAQEINASSSTSSTNRRPVTTIDIGGGLSVNYGHDKDAERVVTMDTYVSMLQAQVPELFDEGYAIITEFGRRLVAHTGLLATLVQAVKRTATTTYVLGHVGADLLLRDVYAAAQWRHPIHVYHPATRTFRGSNDNNNTEAMQVAGPLCFSGDMIARDRLLPADTAAGDVLVIPVAGAYTLSMYSRHTSQLVPAVYGYEGSGTDGDDNNNTLPTFVTLKKAETLDDLVRFWGG